MHHKKVGCTRGSAPHPGDIPDDGGRKSNGAVANYDFVSARSGVEGSRELFLIDQCVSTARSLHKWDVLLPATLPASHSDSFLSPLSSTSPTGYSPLNPLISSRVFGSTAIDSVGGTTRQTSRANCAI